MIKNVHQNEFEKIIKNLHRKYFKKSLLFRSNKKKMPFSYSLLQFCVLFTFIHEFFKMTLLSAGNRNDGLVTRTMPDIRTTPEIVL